MGGRSIISQRWNPDGSYQCEPPTKELVFSVSGRVIETSTYSEFLSEHKSLNSSGYNSMFHSFPSCYHSRFNFRICRYQQIALKLFRMNFRKPSHVSLALSTVYNKQKFKMTFNNTQTVYFTIYVNKTEFINVLHIFTME